MTGLRSRLVALGRRLPAPVRRAAWRGATLPRAATSVRAACGLGGGTALLVHADNDGVSVADLGVRALLTLTDYHLAWVRGTHGSTETANLVTLADQLGVRERLHVITRRWVSAAYLSSADVGLLGFHQQCETTPTGLPSLPAALHRYRAAGLPVAASDHRLVREYLAEHKAGAVFAPGDATALATAARRARRAGKGRDAAAGVSPGPETRARAVVPWRTLGTTPIRLGLATANFAGQLSTFATAICRAREDVSAEVVMAKPTTSFRYPADVYIDFPREHQLAVQLEQIRRVLGGYSHLIVDAFRPVLGRLNGDNISADLPALRRAKVAVALLAHGTEVREPDAHLRRHAESGFLDAPDDLLPRLRDVTRTNQEIARSSGLPVFVTTPDLLDDLPNAIWAPLVVDVAAWACDAPVMRRRRPVVVHAPSNRWTKGTDRILPLLADLHERQVIEFRLVEGVAWDQMRATVRDADIVVDQLVMGGYCALACEAMAAGRVVISYLGETAMAAAGIDPPIVSATPQTLGAAIESLLDDRERAVELATAATTYVREHHDGRRTAAAFDAFLR